MMDLCGLGSYGIGTEKYKALNKGFLESAIAEEIQKLCSHYSFDGKSALRIINYIFDL